MADYLGMGEETSFPTQYLGQQRQMAEIAGRRAATDYTSALARETQNRVRMSELEQEATAKIAGMAAIATEEMQEQEDPVEKLNLIANTYLKSGLVDKGAKVLKHAGEITAQRALAGVRATTESVKRQKADLEMIEKYSEMLGGVEDEEGWELVKNSIAQDEPHVKQWVDKLGRFSPEKARALQSAMTSYRDKAWTANARERTRIYAELNGARTVTEASKRRINDEKLELQRQREARLAKEGGTREARLQRESDDRRARRSDPKKDKAPTAAGMPTKAEIAVVEDQLKALNVGGDVTDHQEIAQEAKIRSRRNPGLSQSQASAQVIQERMQAGDITPGTKEKKFFGLREHTVPGKVFSKSRPEGLPSTLEDAVVGQYYQTPKGVHKYLGDDKFEPVK